MRVITFYEAPDDGLIVRELILKRLYYYKEFDRQKAPNSSYLRCLKPIRK